MSPRSYNMEKRQAAVEETRRRLVLATMEAHNELGVAQTTVPDIAARADVAVGTVYRHFPTLEDAVFACGALTMEMFPLPASDQARELFEDVKGEDRLDLLVQRLAGLYEDWSIVFSRAREAREAFDAVERGYVEMQERVDALVDEALRPIRPTGPQRKTVRSLLDHRFWDTLVDQGLNRAAAERELTALVSAALAKRR